MRDPALMAVLESLCLLVRLLPQIVKARYSIFMTTKNLLVFVCKVCIHSRHHLMTGKDASLYLHFLRVKDLKLMINCSCNNRICARPRNRLHATLTFHVSSWGNASDFCSLSFASNRGNRVISISPRLRLRVNLPQTDAFLVVFNHLGTCSELFL